MNSIGSVLSVVRLSTSSATAAEILNHFASRRRNRRVESVRRLKQVCSSGTSRQAVIGVLRKLETNGFGTFVTGRRGRESRFIWKEV
jgi:hypothetical protein